MAFFEQPCSATYTDGMKELHRWILSVGSVTALMTLGVIADRLRMMWADYKKKHHINGEKEL